MELIQKFDSPDAAEAGLMGMLSEKIAGASATHLPQKVTRAMPLSNSGQKNWRRMWATRCSIRFPSAVKP